MKKIYEKPQMEVVEIGVSQFLCMSTNSGEFGAPEFNPEGDFDMVDHFYHFGDWNI